MPTFLSNLPSVLFSPSLTLDSSFLPFFLLPLQSNGKNNITLIFLSFFPIQKYTKGPGNWYKTITRTTMGTLCINPLFVITSNHVAQRWVYAFKYDEVVGSNLAWWLGTWVFLTFHCFILPLLDVQKRKLWKSQKRTPAAAALPESKHTEISEMGLGQKIKIEGVLAILVVGEKWMNGLW